jgi:dTMP kinase
MPEERIPGRLIAVEGLDGSGKTTQLHLVHRWLLGMDIKVFFSEWNSSAIVRSAIRKGKKKQLLTPTTFSLIHATDFADRYERQILPTLKAGYIVLCDRYVYTSYARDAVRGCDQKWLRRLYGFAAVPDIVFYFRLPLDVAVERILGSRTRLKYFEAGMDLGLSGDIRESFRMFQERVMAHYDRLAEEHGFTVIDSSRAIPEQQEVIRRYIEKRIDLDAYGRRGRGRGVR